MTTQEHILIVDDDAEIRSLLREYFHANGYRASVVADGKSLWALLKTTQPDLIILDVMLPGEDGISLCRTLRARLDVPIIMLTARGGDTDRIVGLEVGADDYLPKPFNPRELLARVKSVLRRTKALPVNLRAEDVRAFRFADWVLDVASRNLTAPDGVIVSLSGTEYKLLRVLLDHPGRVLTRDQLIELMLSRDAGVFDRALDVQVSRLRHRLRDDAKEPAIIKTVRGQGYVLAALVDAER
jgi:two-component system, OmpR family, response regulator